MAGMNNLLRGHDKVERKLNDKPSVVCIQYSSYCNGRQDSEQGMIM
jgi:hypothetical protein